MSSSLTLSLMLSLDAFTKAFTDAFTDAFTYAFTHAFTYAFTCAFNTLCRCAPRCSTLGCRPVGSLSSMISQTGELFTVRTNLIDSYRAAHPKPLPIPAHCPTVPPPPTHTHTHPHPSTPLSGHRAGCRAAVDTYRAERGIASPIVLVPYAAKEWVRGAYWRKPLYPPAKARAGSTAAAPAGLGAAFRRMLSGSSSHQPARPAPAPMAQQTQNLCVGSPPNSLRIPGSLSPPNAIPVGPPAKPSWDGDVYSPGLSGYQPPGQIYMCAD